MTGSHFSRACLNSWNVTPRAHMGMLGRVWLRPSSASLVKLIKSMTPGYSVMVDLLLPWSAHREDLAVECAPIGSETGSESKEGPNVHVDHQNTLC